MANRPGHCDRRRFLRLAAAAGATLLVPAPLLALARRAAPEERRLELAMIHTGEHAVVPFRRGGRPVPGALDRLARLLRDHRTGAVHPIDPRLPDLLWEVAREAGAAPRFTVISGYRSPATNALLRRQGHHVATHSYHLQGRAADVRLAGVTVTDLADAARSLRTGGVGLYRRDDFVHLDTGPYRTW